MYYLVPPNGAPPSIAPSMARKERGIGTFEPHSDYAVNAVEHPPKTDAYQHELGNPTVVPSDILGQFHFTFLIRHPRHSIPSYYRCTVPPLDEITGWYNFMPSEAGYVELRRVFDYLRAVGLVGPQIASKDICVAEDTKGSAKAVDICVVDADELLDDPAGIVSAYCKSVGLEYHEQMLGWDSEEDHKHAKQAWEKWPGFHEDALNSRDLKPRKEVSDLQLTPIGKFQPSALSPLTLIKTLICMTKRRTKRRARKKRTANGLKSMGRKEQN